GSPGNGQQLPLALAQVSAVSGEHGVISLRKHLDESIGVGQPCCGLHFLLGSIQLSVLDVLGYGAGEQVSVLKNDAQALAKVALLDFADGDAIIPDGALLDVIEP